MTAKGRVLETGTRLCRDHPTALSGRDQEGGPPSLCGRE